ncbi:hypothetical protein YC2023_085662 [Brassica napus]
MTKRRSLRSKISDMQDLLLSDRSLITDNLSIGRKKPSARVGDDEPTASLSLVVVLNLKRKLFKSRSGGCSTESGNLSLAAQFRCLEDALTSSHAPQCGALNLSCPFQIRAAAGVVNSFSSGGSRWMSCLLVRLCGVAIRAAQALAKSDQLRHSAAPLSSASSFDWDGRALDEAVGAEWFCGLTISVARDDLEAHQCDSGSLVHSFSRQRAR